MKKEEINELIVDNYDFSQFNKILEITNTHSLAITIAERYKDLKFIIVLSNEILEEIKKEIESKEFQENFELIIGSIFDNLPKGYNLCVIKNLLENYKNEELLNILNNFSKSMQINDRLLIIEENDFTKTTNLTEEQLKQILRNSNFILTNNIKVNNDINIIETIRL